MQQKRINMNFFETLNDLFNFLHLSYICKALLFWILDKHKKSNII